MFTAIILSISTIISTSLTAVAALTINSSSLLSLPMSNVTNLGIPFDRVCRGARFGSTISPESCADALLQIDASDRRERVYSERVGPGGGGPDVKLPRRYISCEFCAKRCGDVGAEADWEIGV